MIAHSMPEEVRRERTVPLPAESRIANLFVGADLADAYAIGLPSNSSRDIEMLTRFMLGETPPWLRLLMGVRDTMVAGFGIKTSAQLRDAPIGDASDRIYIFRVYAVDAREMILGEDDKHLDFRVSVLLRPMGGADNGRVEIVVTTVVHCHNPLGRTYLALIAPFHRIVARSMLSRASRRGWPESVPL